ncbi:DUF2955 domain-containing protein [Shewanella maritima]|uniref:DUF2955 domain-containing protein n=1 Tax=Shewanella maritima TaxID=2520507 RepID=UPI0037358E2B
MSDKALAQTTDVDSQKLIVTRRVLRFTLAMGVAILVSALVAWPLAFIVPVFVAKFLVDRQAPTLQTFYELLASMLVIGFIAWVVTFGPVQYPAVLMPVIAIAMLWAYYLFSDPRWNFFALMVIIATLLLPYMAVLHPGMAGIVAFGLGLSGLVAVIIFSLFHVILPDLAPEKDELNAPELSSESRQNAAFKALVLAYPVICVFYILQITDALLTMIFIAILSLQTTENNTVKVSLFLLITNVIGGILAIAFYNVIVISPSLIFYVGFMMLLAIFFATKIYHNPEKAPIFATIFSTLLVLLCSAVTSSDADVANSFYIRIAQIFMVSVYMIVMSFFLETRQWRWLKT